MLSKKLKILILFSFSLVWLVFTSEMYLRIFKPHPILPRYVQSGDFGIRVNMPNESYVHKTADYKVFLKTNSNGVRANQDIPYEKGQQKRILLLGDSFGMGYGVDIQDTFTAVLERELEAQVNLEFEVINLSVSGFGTAEQLIMLQNEGVKYSPDIVIATWHSTDLLENIRSGLFRIEGETVISESSKYLPGVKQRELLYRSALFRYFAENSHFYNFMRGKLAGIVKRLLLINSASADNDIQLNDLSKSENAVKLNLSLLKKLEKVSLNAGAKFIVLDIPNRDSRVDFSTLMPSQIANSFDVVSPLATFRSNAGQLLYWERSNGHFTPLGCRLVGEQLAEYIIPTL